MDVDSAKCRGRVSTHCFPSGGASRERWLHCKHLLRWKKLRVDIVGYTVSYLDYSYC